MSDIVLKVENLSKQYRLGEIGTGTLSHDLNRLWAKIRGKEDPFSVVGEENDRTKSAKSDYVWALKDVSFQVEKGEILGVIGKNGAGKSTLLKLISRVTSPSEGYVKAKGRIASLLEVGTGMHPEMTGRENIYLNGAILGMKKKEITSKFNEIVEFAGCKMYIDTPVKRYSSGMRVRLGFAVAAFLEPEILIVDEVLAVGDMEFQKKAVGKMKEVSSAGGRTVLFVSHNMASIKSLCNRCIVLKNGMIDYVGETIDAITHYQSVYDVNDHSTQRWSLDEAPGNSKVKLLSIEASPLEGDVIEITSGVRIKYTFHNFIEGVSLGTTLEVENKDGVLIFHTGNYAAMDNSSEVGVYSAELEVPSYLLNTNHYSINLMFGHNRQLALKLEGIVQFFVENSTVNGVFFNLPGVIRPQLNLKTAFEEAKVIEK